MGLGYFNVAFNLWEMLLFDVPAIDNDIFMELTIHIEFQWWTI